MKVEELNREQLTELKEHYYTEKNENVSYGELASINELVSDNEIFEEYSGVYFVEEDFSCQVDNTRLYNDFMEIIGKYNNTEIEKLANDLLEYVKND